MYVFSTIPFIVFFLKYHKLTLCKNAEDVVAYHKGRVSQAIFEIFPNIGFDKAMYQAGSMHIVVYFFLIIISSSFLFAPTN
jgi:hypothetical protein